MIALRWILVLPAALSGAFAAYWVNYFAHILTTFKFIEFNNVLNHTLFIQIMGTVLATVGFIYAGTYTAPKLRPKAALLLAITAFILNALPAYIAIFVHGKWYLSLAAIAGALASIMAYKEISKDPDNLFKREF